MRLTSALPCLLALLFAGSLPSSATTIYVNKAAPDTVHDGATWATSYLTVQAGLNAATAGDEVWVAAGTYLENITLASGVGLYGGFSGKETSREQRDPRTNLSILDGGNNYKSVVTITASATSDTVLDGFLIQHGETSAGVPPYNGAGVYVYGGTPVISNNTIRFCWAYGFLHTLSYGGGIYAPTGAPRIERNIIYDNYAAFGGGVYAQGGVVRDNLFDGNGAGDYQSAGGGLLINNGVVVHNTFAYNASYGATFGGGGAACSGSVVVGNLFLDNGGSSAASLCTLGTCTVLRNVFITEKATGIITHVRFDKGVFSDNLVIAQGAYGLYLVSARETTPVISNNTILHRGSTTGTAIFSEYFYADTPIVSNNLITGWEKAANGIAASEYSIPPVFTTDHNDVFGNTDNTMNLPGASQVGQNGNISVDPLFVDPSKGDYHLQAGSPLIDSGNDAVVKAGECNLDRGPRIAGAHVDIGAYEYGSPLYTLQDTALVLRIAAGMMVSTPAETSRLDMVGGSGLTMADATRIAQWLLN